jgi:excisionase family DNA binding protein
MSLPKTNALATLLTPGQAAEVLSVPRGTLAQWRSQRRGPAFVKLEGRLVRYRSTDLEKYISGRIIETELTDCHA